MNHFKRDLVLAGCAFAVLGYFTASAQQPSFRADELTDFVGLNASPFNRYLDAGPYDGTGTKYRRSFSSISASAIIGPDCSTIWSNPIRRI